MVSNNQVERLARVEEQVNELRVKVDRIEEKLDDLIALKYKGAGIFWLASALFGTGIVSAFIEMIHYFGVGNGR